MKHILIIIPLLCAASTVRAQQAVNAQSQDGAQTRAWIELQTRAADSPAPPRPVSGEVADQVYQRYLKSFSHPIPDQFDRQKFVESGGQ